MILKPLDPRRSSDAQRPELVERNAAGVGDGHRQLIPARSLDTARKLDADRRRYCDTPAVATGGHMQSR